MLAFRRAALAAIVATAGAQPPAPSTFPFQNPDLAAEERISDLISRLTLEEKIDCMAGRAAVPRLDRRAGRVEVMVGTSSSDRDLALRRVLDVAP